MSSSRKQLLMHGYMREFCRLNAMKFPVNDLIDLFAKWVSIIDGWHKTQSHKEIKFERNTIAYIGGDASYASCFGEWIAEKGGKYCWRVKINSLWITVGIIDAAVIETSKMIGDFTNEIYEGYGIVLGSNKICHAYSIASFPYAQQFGNLAGKDVEITVELDLTQNECQNGALKYIIHSNNHLDIKTTGKWTNIAFDDIDINKKYSLAVDIGGESKQVELVSSSSLFDSVTVC